MSIRTFVCELAYKGEVICSRLQGIAYDRPARNGEYLLVRRTADSLRLAIDVGANVGDWTAEVIRATGRRARVVSVEADADNARILKERFAQQQNVTVIEAAVTLRNGSVNFVSGAGPGSGNGYVTFGDPGVKGSRVVARTLQDIVAELGDPPVDLVKCDVEGAELDVLAGATELFERRRIALMQVEYNATWMRARRSLRELFGFARRHDYQLLIATPFGLSQLPSYGPGLEDYRLRNIILARQDSIGMLRPYGPAGRARVEHKRQENCGQ
jgi:FkbM family methyltransferase